MASGKQDFCALREEHLKSGTLFDDPEFPPNLCSIACNNKPKNKPVKWMRPKEIRKDAKFFSNGSSRFDVNQGCLQDCWFLAVVTSLTLNNNNFFQIIPDDNSLEENYAGIFHFRFFKKGEKGEKDKWVEVVIDDRLPVYFKDGKLKLLYSYSTDENEFWPALLEKAYAKFNESYEALANGNVCEALEGMTGGIGLTITLDNEKSSNERDDICKLMKTTFENNHMICCCSYPPPNKNKKARDKDGIVFSHAYTITGIETLKIDDGDKFSEYRLIRVRNPWGYFEWDSDWSDNSSKWNLASQEIKKKINFKPNQDGEFWMEFDDFYTRFSSIKLCNVFSMELNPYNQINSGMKKVFEGPLKNGIIQKFSLDFSDKLFKVLVHISQTNRRKLKKCFSDNSVWRCINYTIQKHCDDKQTEENLNNAIVNHKSKYPQTIVCNSHEINSGSYTIVWNCKLKDDKQDQGQQNQEQHDEDIEVYIQIFMNNFKFISQNLS